MEAGSPGSPGSMEHVGRGCGAAVRPGPSQPILRLPRTGLMPRYLPPQARSAGAPPRCLACHAPLSTPPGTACRCASPSGERASRMRRRLTRLTTPCWLGHLLTTHYPLHYSLLNLTPYYFSTYCSLLTTHNSQLTTNYYCLQATPSQMEQLGLLTNHLLPAAHY